MNIINKNIFIILLYLITLACFSCANKTDYRNNENQYLNKTDSLVIKLPDSARARGLNISIIGEKTNHPAMIYHHPEIDAIIEYNLITGEVSQTIKYEKEGDNGVGNPYSVFAFSIDSIFVFDIWTQKISLINSQAKLLDSYSIQSDSNYVLINTSHAPQLVGDKLYLTVYPNPLYTINSNRDCVLILDLQTKEKAFKGKISSKFDEGFWGNSHYVYPTIKYNRNTDIFFVRYPNDHNFYTVNEEFSDFKNISVRNKYISELKPLNSSTEESSIIYKFTALQGQFRDFLINQNTDAVYSFFYPPIDYEYQNPGDTEHLLGVHVLDSQFSSKGYHFFYNDTYYTDYMFIYNNKLYCLDFDYYNNENDNVLKFDIYQLNT